MRGHRQSAATKAKISASLLEFHRSHSHELHSGMFKALRAHSVKNPRNTSAGRHFAVEANRRKQIAAQRRNAFLAGDSHNPLAQPANKKTRRKVANRPAPPKVIEGRILEGRSRVKTTQKAPKGSHASSALPTTGTKSLGKATTPKASTPKAATGGKKSRVLSSAQKDAKAARAKRRRAAKKG